MRVILLAVACLCLGAFAAQAQTTEEPFRDAAVVRAIKYVKISANDQYVKEAYRLADQAGYKNENIGVHGAISDFAYQNDWCEFRKLNKSEQHEMFDLRLAHHVILRRYATEFLNRDIAKKGFGWHIDGFRDNDYNSTDQGQTLGRKFFTQALAKHGFTPCER